MLIQKARHFGWGDVSTTLEEALGQDRNCVGVSGDQLSEDISEFDFVFEGGDGSAFRSSLPVRKKDG